MQRIFQNYEGEVKALIGTKFSIVLALVSERDNDVVLLWLKGSEFWYRLFIDGVYCGIDKYVEDKSQEDLDDDVDYIDYSKWFSGKTVVSAKVTNRENINLSIEFNDKSLFSLNCTSPEGECHLSFVESGHT